MPQFKKRRVCSMKAKMVFGALLLSAALCSQGFGFELLANMVGLNRGGGQCCEPACEPECCEPACETCCKRRDLFGRMKGLFACKSCCKPVCGDKVACCAPEPECCEPECCEPACEPECCEPACCEPECCEPACKPACRKRGPLCCLLDDLFGRRKCCARTACCEQACCEPACCEPACGGAGEASASDRAAPLPIAPAADPSATLWQSRNIHQTARNIVSR